MKFLSLPQTVIVKSGYCDIKGSGGDACRKNT